MLILPVCGVVYSTYIVVSPLRDGMVTSAIIPICRDQMNGSECCINNCRTHHCNLANIEMSSTILCAHMIIYCTIAFGK